MRWFKLFTNRPKNESLPQKGTVVITPTVQTVRQVWRNNMWVMTPDGVGIIFELREPVRVHLVNQIGITVADKEYNSSDIRQAKYDEIPEMRRGDREKAKRLGYE